MSNDWMVKCRAGARLASVLCLVLVAASCGLNDVDIPEFDGPSELAESLRLTVSPDVITADGFSTAFIQGEFGDQSNRPLANRDIIFAINDESGRFADIGILATLEGVRLFGGSAIVRTNGQGLAQLIYQAPARTDATANQSILVTARPVGTDFNSATYRTVRLELRSAEPRLFPQVPSCDAPNAPPAPLCNNPPSCFFIFEAPDGFRVGRNILFQTTAADVDGTIVRYEWFFGDGSPTEYFPDVNHTFGHAGTFTVTHKCTDDDGAQNATATTLVITN